MERRNKEILEHLSFSIILETENLASVDPGLVIDTIESLNGDNISTKDASEFIITNSGDIPDNLLVRLNQDYPWVKIIEVKEGDSYYEAKMEGFNETTGEIVVFCDSDCVYCKNWLEISLLPFMRHKNVQIVGGETSLKLNSPLEMAMLFVWIFGPFSRKKNIYQSSNYFFNNVSFRRSLINEIPFVKNIELYRSDHVFHFAQLKNAGVQIWKNPDSKAYHPIPDTLSKVMWRLIMNSHSFYHRHCLGNDLKVNYNKISIHKKLEACIYALIFWMGRPIKRLFKLNKREFKKLHLLPIAILILLFLELVMIYGTMASMIRPESIYQKAIYKLED